MAHFFKKNLRVIIITDRLRNLKALINGLIVPWLRHPRHTSTTINLIIIFKFLPMTAFEPLTSGIGSDRSTNWAKTTASILLLGQGVI